MTQLKPSPIPRSRGFSLIELMVVVSIAGILTAIALPAYRSYVLKSHRTEAKTALLDLAGREERYYNTNNAYTATQAGLGYGTTGNVTNLSVGSGYYQVSITNVAAPTATTAATYTITAAAVSNQTKDTPCWSFTVTSLGAQTALDSLGADDSTACWH
jgi:type IV pilus assembly protein PilE